MKHTQGKWEYRGSDPTNIYSGGNHIASVYYQDRYNKDIQQLANAKLIAAAPDLLNTCIIIKNDFESKIELFEEDSGLIDPEFIELIELINKAIKKATE